MLDHNFLPDGLAGWLAATTHRVKGRVKERNEAARQRMSWTRDAATLNVRTETYTHNRANEW